MRSPRPRSISDSAGPSGAADPVDPQRQEELAFAHCLRRLTAAPRTEAELADSMRSRGYLDEVIGTVLGRLRAARYVDDREFARAWVESRTRTRALGAPVLRAELLRKGLDDELIADALAGIDHDQRDEQARHLIRRRLGADAARFGELEREQQDRLLRRVVGMLARKGHSSGSAYALVREVIEQERDQA